MYLVAFITVPKKKEARNLARAIVRNKAGACVNIVDKIDSLFWWQAKVDRARELLLIVKTKSSNFSKLTKLVESMHSYTVPEIIALPIVKGNRSYLRWIDESC